MFKMLGSELTGKWINRALAEVEKAIALQSDALVGATPAEVHAGRRAIPHTSRRPPPSSPPAALAHHKLHCCSPRDIITSQLTLRTGCQYV